ncbi:ABC transporter ATP-binding protein [Pseudaestuariivita atlantica]|uniref:ABC transporter ATPase n=1 Tax=Pseudaestuariivita atlantica TaxID=1317121 RepID=A0A0L1JNE3_9RHOB|nr:ABC transporter ATP-binding protein [Pseudaestuariivita atlantica]KNG93280.1 ABC transporter ATPase [Pseudaestuariivita atlantica]
MTAPPAIEVRGTLRMDGRDLFRDLDLRIAPGEWTCLLGPSGVGKSTILRLILGLETGGTFDGSVTASDGQALEGRCGYMAQEDLLLPWRDVRGNVGLGASLRGVPVDAAKVDALIARVGLSEHADKTPRALSGGMRQRVALARTLMEDRPVVLLDEPFSALDARTRADMQELAADVLKGRTVLLVTHDPAEAIRLGHHVHVLTQAGLSGWPVPEADPVRDVQAAETQRAQADLLAHLRAIAT